MQNDLKPCPFCGGEGHMKLVMRKEALEKFQDRSEVLGSYPPRWWVIGCKTEGCILEFNPDKHFIKLAFHFGHKDEAIEKWNRRAE